jgi:Tfp pilus assembly PilM family ATPase
MMKNKDITSTEKLLDLIRGKNGKTAAVHKPPGKKSLPDALTRLKNLRPMRQAETVGVDIGHSFLFLAKIARTGQTWKLLDHRRVPIPKKPDRKPAAFTEKIRGELTSFCGSSGIPDIWAIMSAADMEIRFIRIPKVASEHIEQTVYWTFKKETALDERLVVFDFMVQGEVVEQGAVKLNVMVYTVPRDEVVRLRDFFTGMGFPLTGLSVTSFAVENILRSGGLSTGEKNLANLFIGNEFSRIDIFSGGMLVMLRDINTGVNSVLDILTESYAGVLTDVAPLTNEQARGIIVNVNKGDDEFPGSDFGLKNGRDEIVEMIAPAMERLIRQVERTVEHYNASFGQKPLERIFVSSVMPRNEHFVRYVEGHTGIPSAVFDPLAGALPKEDHAGRNTLLPAVGAALSDKKATPNFIFTHKEKKIAARIARVNKAALAVFLVALTICAGGYFRQRAVIAQKKAELAELGRQIEQLGPEMNPSVINVLTQDIASRQQKLKAYGRRYMEVAVFGELSELTPPGIHLTGVTVRPLDASAKKTDEAANLNLGSGAADEEGARKASGGTVELSGIILGDQQDLDSALVAYVAKLSESRLFQNALVMKGQLTSESKGESDKGKKMNLAANFTKFALNMEVRAE